MKYLKHLNKYFLKYKWYLILGTLFTFVSNLFGVVPAQIVRYALDLVKETIDLYFLFDGFKLQSSIYEFFAFSILLYGLMILVLALLKGFFLFLHFIRFFKWAVIKPSSVVHQLVYPYGFCIGEFANAIRC